MYKSFKYIRMALAALVLLGITALLLDGTGMLRHWLGWLPKVQLLPAILALNFVVVVAVLLTTVLIGRLYCSLLCPMGIFLDILIWFHKLIFGKKRPFRYRKPANWLRYTVLVLFVVAMLAGFGSVAALIAPYSAYARMVTNIHGSGAIQWVAIITLVVIGLLGFTMGRTWCNTVCPVGTLLGLISKHSIFGIRIDASKCGGCRQCEKACKAMCIDIEGGKTIDNSRCVDCFNCLSECKVGALTFSRNTATGRVDASRRTFVATTLAVGAATVLHAQEQKVDGGLAALLDKSVPKRNVPLRPSGAVSQKNFESRCTACQLCVGQCPEKVLRPSGDLSSFLQPYMAYDQGYCRMACTRCSEVCPTGAIQPVSKEQKTAISIGLAVALHDNCLSAEGVNCGACARHCPAGAITMVDNGSGRPVPAVNESKCTGCGACEYYCPARPMTAIYVEGRQRHAEI